MSMTLKVKPKIKAELIAPCGMNCVICMGRLLKDKNKCPGCRGNDIYKPKYCVGCVILNYDFLKKSKSKYCSVKCEKFPCMRLKNLDKRYRTRYNMSMIENLKNIEELGIRTFIKNDKNSG